MSRTVLRIALAFTAVFGFFTAYALFRYGPRPLELLSLLVLAMIGFGVVGALREPPRQ